MVRRYYELLNAADLDGCEGLLARDFRLFEPSLLDAGEHHGLAGMRRWFTRMQEAWSVMRWDPEEFIEAGDWVIARVRFSSTAAHTEIEYDVERFQTMCVEDGRIAFATGYASLEKARAAVGLDA